MTDYLFAFLCVSPALAAIVSLIFAVAGMPVLMGLFGGYAIVGFLSPSYYRGIADIWTHGVHNDR